MTIACAGEIRERIRRQTGSNELAARLVPAQGNEQELALRAELLRQTILQRLDLQQPSLSVGLPCSACQSLHTHSSCTGQPIAVLRVVLPSQGAPCGSLNMAVHHHCNTLIPCINS